MRKLFTIILAALLLGTGAAIQAKTVKKGGKKAPKTTKVQTAGSANTPVKKQKAPDPVDLGLSVKWAPCNLGAARPADMGNYYSWGELRTKAVYADSLCATFNRNFEHREIAGDTLYDAATVRWGGKWRMPTSAEIAALIDSCQWTPATISGVKGFNVKGPSGKSIFLPLGGMKYGKVLLDEGKDGYYWSSSPVSTRLAEILLIEEKGPTPFSFSRSSGLLIRPVSD